MSVHPEMTFTQGSQPHLNGVRVGIHRVGEPGGKPTARLLLRDGVQRKRVDLTEDVPIDLLGRGTVELVAVHRPAPGEQSAAVTLRLRD